MRTWRYNESNGIHYYYVGNARVGTVSFDATKTISDPNKWRAFCRLTVLKSLEPRATVEEAKSAVEDIVTRWLERAGLVEMPADRCPMCDGMLPSGMLATEGKC